MTERKTMKLFISIVMFVAVLSASAANTLSTRHRTHIQLTEADASEI